MLPTEHLEIYQLFLSGHFVVKVNAGSFNGVGLWLWDVIWQTSNRKFITDWESAYEILSNCNAFQNKTNDVDLERMICIMILVVI